MCKLVNPTIMLFYKYGMPTYMHIEIFAAEIWHDSVKTTVASAYMY